MAKEIITIRIKDKLENYKKEFGQNELTSVLVIMTEILAEISLNVENIANKGWE